MRCCSRSTAWLVSAWLAATMIAAGTARAQPEPVDEAAIRLALIQTVRDKMGAKAAVRLESVVLSLSAPIDAARVTATPEPGSRLGRPVRFLLSIPSQTGRAGMRRIGSAVAAVHVAVEHACVATAVARGAILSDTDLAVEDGEVETGPLAPVPVRADLVGGRAVRDLLVGEVVTLALVRAQPLIKAGETVRATFKLGDVEAVGQALAQQSGYRNDRIRLINPESRRPFYGRVTGPGEVEVIHAP